MQSNSTVLITVPCYNGEKYLRETLESIHNQTYSNWGLLFINDASTDRSKDVFSNFVNHHNCRYKTWAFGNSRMNKGVTDCKQKGLDFANYKSYDYFMTLDADDTIEPDYLEKMVDFLEKIENEDYGYVYCDTNYMWERENDKVLQRIFQPEFNAVSLLENNFMSYCSLFRVESLSGCGYDLNNFGRWEDYQLYLRLLRNGVYGKRLPEALFNYRIHPSQTVQDPYFKKAEGLYKAYIISQLPETFPVSWVNESLKMLEGLPKYFMSFNKEDFKNVIVEWEKNNG